MKSDDEYTRTIDDGRGGQATQLIRVSEYDSDRVKIDLYVNGSFKGTWIKNTVHFARIIERDRWSRVVTKSLHIPEQVHRPLASALEQAVSRWSE